MHRITTCLIIALLGTVNLVHAGKKLKIYILAGQSNMQGQASSSTFPAMAWDPASKALHDKFVDENGEPRVYKDVQVAAISQSGGWGSPTPDQAKNGPLTVGFGSNLTEDDRLGPELGFGVTMFEHLNQPILIIKTAWGGKSLHTDFRSPSGGPYYESTEGLTDKTNRKTGKVTTVKEQIAAKEAATGKYYRLMTEHVKKVLADPGKYHPAYDKDAGYEVAGFVWFQGFNDLIAGIYPQTKTEDGKKGPKDFSLYSKLLACFIRDVRKEFNAPKMPFVIGVMGIGGVKVDDQQMAFRKAMAAPADMPEFKGNVVAVQAGKFWDSHLADVLGRFKKVTVKKKRAKLGHKYDDLIEKLGPLLAEYDEADERWRAYDKKFVKAKKTKLSQSSPAEFKAIMNENRKLKQQVKDIAAKLEKAMFTEEELRLRSVGRSSQGFHYMGSAKVYGLIGEAFAEAILKLDGNDTHK